MIYDLKNLWGELYPGCASGRLRVKNHTAIYDARKSFNRKKDHPVAAYYPEHPDCRIYLWTGVEHPAGSDSREVCFVSDGYSLRIVDVERVGYKENVRARIEDLSQTFL